MALVQIKQPKQRLKMKQVAKGLWEVEGAYSGSYDFFECSPLYSKNRASTTSAPEARNTTTAPPAEPEK